MIPPDQPRLRIRQRLGKYRIEKRLAEGGFASVYRAYDTIEATSVAIKVPHQHVLSKGTLRELTREVRTSSVLDHPNILPVKNATIEGGVFLIAYPLGRGTLDGRMRRKLPPKQALDFAEQALEALAYAHNKRVIHCDVKPDNFILFPNNTLKLHDFGIAKIARRTFKAASGSGTLGYVSPEQAFGKPSFRSDVFSMGLLIYRMLSGVLPEWPYEWPARGNRRLKQVVNRDFVDFLRKSLEVDERRRFRDCTAMLRAFRRLRPHALKKGRPSATAKRGAKKDRAVSAKRTGGRKKTDSVLTDWQELRFKEFEKLFRKSLPCTHDCSRCGGPVADVFSSCPWCGKDQKIYKGIPEFPLQCTRCGRGSKLDWRFCAWCYGAGEEPETTREYSDKRYSAKCSNSRCERKDLMPFMKYCPWCRTKVKRKWPLEGSRQRCGRCSWGIIREFWDFCPWCGTSCSGTHGKKSGR